MSAKPAPLAPSYPAPLAPARLGRPERIALAILAALTTLLLAAWQIPPMLDWSRYRGTIATYASTRLARPVTIAGQVRLTLLPRPMLLADQVTLADGGDGISAQLGTLRLEVALPDLLLGRITPRALSLDNPTATLPWPPPRGTTPHLPARAAAAFSASVTGGTLILGGITLHDITGTLSTDPDTGAFAASGNAQAAGLPWRFTALLGAPGTDGISPLSLTLDGRPAPHLAHAITPDMAGTGGAFHGRLLADGSLTGTLSLRGPDLSRLGAGPALPWQLQGSVTGDNLTLRAPDLDLRLANSPGRASVTLHLDSPTSLALAANIGQLPAGAWLTRLLQQAAHPAITADIDLTAGALATPTRLLASPHLHLTLAPTGTQIQTAAITLPGGTQLTATGALKSDTFTGQLTVQAPALHDTLAWLTGTPTALPPSILANAKLHGTLTATPARLTWSNLTGQLDGSPITGTLATTLAPHPALTIALSTPRLPLAGWDEPLPTTPPSLATIMAPLTQADLTLTLTAAQLDLPSLPLRHATLAAEANQTGLTLHHLALDLPGAHLEAAGHLAPDGTLTNAAADLSAPNAAALPPAWPIPAKLGQGSLHVALNAAGPPANLAIALRADLADLRAEAEGHLDATAPALDATITLRHPGAPRLLAASGLLATLNLPEPSTWLDEGSLAVLAHLTATPRHLRATNVSISAGALQITGALDAASTPTGLQLTGSIDAPTLALPAWPARSAGLPNWAWLRTIQARIALKAGRILSGLTPVASDASATLLAGSGLAMIADAQAQLPTGHLAGALALDTSQLPPAFSLLATATGIPPEAILPDTPGLSLRGGLMDVTADLHGQGYGQAARLASASGTLTLDLHGNSLAGLDLATRPARPGAITPLDGSLQASLRDGVATLAAGRLTGPAGTIEISGTIDTVQRSLALRLAALPDAPGTPRRTIGLNGPWATARAIADPPATHSKAPAQRARSKRPGK